MILILFQACGVTPELDTAISALEEPEQQFASIAEDDQSVISLEPERYLGVWYEIATTPGFQQQNCVGTTATYSLIDTETIGVLNECWLGSFEGNRNRIEGTATAIDESYARLLVDFNFGFQAPYNVVELDGSSGSEPYQFAAVASYNALWILSRSPEIDEELLAELLERLEEREFPVDRLEYTPHP